MHMCVYEYIYIYQDIKSLEYCLYLLLIIILMHSQGLSISL